MKAQINVPIPLNVNVYNVIDDVLICYKDGPLEVAGMGKDFFDALNDFRIEFAKRVHDIRWAAGWKDADITYQSNEPRTALSGFPVHREWGTPLKSRRTL
jgi:hypothetical protein